MTEAITDHADNGKKRQIETHMLIWQGITIEITWEAYWLFPPGADRAPAHLCIHSLIPERAPLPMTETGYRSHFTTRETVAEAGGPVAFIQAWLEAAAQSPAWRKHVAEAMQPSLF